MAAEVDSCDYLLLAVDHARNVGSFNMEDGGDENAEPAFVSDSSDEEVTILPAPDGTETKSTMVFKHNPLHDLESVLWLALYLLLCTMLHLEKPLDMPDEVWQMHADAKDEVAALLFHDGKKRISFITSDSTFMSMTIRLHPRIRGICSALEKLRSLLSSAYKFAESEPENRLKFRQILRVTMAVPFSREGTLPKPLHHAFAHVFRKISRDLARDGDVTFQKIPSISEQRRMMHDLLLQQQSEAGAKAPNAARTTGDIEPARRTRAKNARQPRTEDPGVVAMTGQLSKLRPRD